MALERGKEKGEKERKKQVEKKESYTGKKVPLWLPGEQTKRQNRGSESSVDEQPACLGITPCVGPTATKNREQKI